jgi:ArsR family transcriptional regulator
MESKIELFKSLGDGNRIRIVCMLAVRDLCVCEINSVLNVSMSTISSHLKVLRNAGVVTSRKDGRWIIYRLCKDNELVKEVTELCVKHLSDEDVIAGDRAKLDEVSAETCVN